MLLTFLKDDKIKNYRNFNSQMCLKLILIYEFQMRVLVLVIFAKLIEAQLFLCK